MKYDYLIIGAGLFGATFAYRARMKGKRCLVIEKRPQTGGNIFCSCTEGINVHKYGAHIFHTSDKDVWDFVNSLVEFNRYTNSPVADFNGKLFNLPFNMNTFHQMWGVRTPAEAAAKIEQQRQEALQRMHDENAAEPRNLEEQALVLVGKDLSGLLCRNLDIKFLGNSHLTKLLSSSELQIDAVGVELKLLCTVEVAVYLELQLLNIVVDLNGGSIEMSALITECRRKSLTRSNIVGHVSDTA